MKEKAPFWLLGSMLFLGVVAGFVPSVPKAYAEDRKVTTLSMSIDAGADSICTNALSTNHKYRVQPTVNAYVSVSPTGDGGSPDITTNDVLVGQYKLYEVWTTQTKRFICCKPQVAGAASSCNIKEPNPQVEP